MIIYSIHGPPTPSWHSTIYKTAVLRKVSADTKDTPGQPYTYTRDILHHPWTVLGIELLVDTILRQDSPRFRHLANHELGLGLQAAGLRAGGFG